MLSRYAARVWIVAAVRQPCRPFNNENLPRGPSIVAHPPSPGGAAPYVVPRVSLGTTSRCARVLDGPGDHLFLFLPQAIVRVAWVGAAGRGPFAGAHHRRKRLEPIPGCVARMPRLQDLGQLNNARVWGAELFHRPGGVGLPNGLVGTVCATKPDIKSAGPGAPVPLPRPRRAAEITFDDGSVLAYHRREKPWESTTFANGLKDFHGRPARKSRSSRNRRAPAARLTMPLSDLPAAVFVSPTTRRPAPCGTVSERPVRPTRMRTPGYAGSRGQGALPGSVPQDYRDFFAGQLLPRLQNSILRFFVRETCPVRTAVGTCEPYCNIDALT